MRNARRLGFALLLVAVLAACLAAGAQADPAARLCDRSRTLQLDVARTAALPINAGRPLGVTGARRLAATITGHADFCSGPVPAWLARELRRAQGLAHRRDRAGASRAFAAIQRRIASTHMPRRRAVARAGGAGGCPVGQAPKVAPDGKTQQFVAEAAAAMRAGDAAAADSAMAAARQSYGDWADSYDSSSVSDYVAIAKGAQVLGVDDAGNRAMDRARARAKADAKRQQSAEVDTCTADSTAMGCAVRSVAVAQLVGADVELDVSKLSRMSQAIADRIQGNVPPWCERWTFQMQLAMPADGKGLLEDFVITYGAATIDLNRDTGALIVARGGDPPLAIGSPKGRCYEEGPNGNIDHGPAQVIGGLFRYGITGSATPDTIELELRMIGASISVTFAGDGNQWCQALRDMGNMFTATFVNIPWPVSVPVAPGQRQVDIVDASSGMRFELHMTRVR